MSERPNYFIYCRQFANSHDDRIYTCDDLGSAKELFRRAVTEYHKYLRDIGLRINKIVYEGPSTKEEAEECLPLVTFITDDRLMFEVEMVKCRL